MKKRATKGEESWQNFLGAGCYQYAIDFYSNEFLVVGDIIGKRCSEHVSDETLVETLIEELKVLGYNVKEVETDTQIKNGEKKIYLQRDEHTGYYHFLKQDSDGIWSHKYPGEMPITIDNSGQEIDDPESMVEPPFYGWCFCLTKS